MAKVLMFASIDSFSPEDLNAMFEMICKKIIKKKPSDVKKDILLVKGKPAEIEKYQVTVVDIMNMVVAMDIKFDFKINYLEGEDDVKEEVVIPEAKPSVIEDQKKDIKLGELKEIAASSSAVIEGENTQNNIEPVAIPPAPTFLQQE